jgi:hypothetical protein
MTDDLERLKARISDVGLDAADAMNEAIARIQALLAEREELVECNEQFSVDNQFLKKRAEKAEADNARLREAMTGIKRAAAHRMQNDRRDLHSYYFHTAFAALNTGKGPSHD